MFLVWLEQSRNRPAADVVRAANLGKRLLALVAAAEGFFDLVRGELSRASHFHALRLGTLAALARAGVDQFTLELGKAAKDREHQTAMRARRVGPYVAQGPESGSGLGDRVERVQQVARRSRQPVKARHRQHVALVELREGKAQLRAVAARAAGRFPKDLFGSGGLELFHLRVNALAVCRDSCIAVNHAVLMHVIFAQKKGFSIKGLSFVHNS